MKKLIAVFFTLAFAASMLAQSYVAPIGPKKTQPHRRNAHISSREVDGIVPRAARGGNPLQMFNPRAPARYGTSDQSVLLKPDGSGRWNGIKFFAFYF